MPAGMRKLLLLIVLCGFILPNFATAQESGLPIPRFVALRSDKVHLRSGPGLRYPKVWIYQHSHLPMEVVSEFDTWRKVRDWEGSEGWVHQSLLIGTRYVIVTGDEITMYTAADKNARPIALVKAGVVGRVERCPKGVDWCQVQFQDYDGWVQRQGIWGVYDNETIE
ncbi:SH3 domain-containing protein [uncultured Thalassospira sp.]|uniref:SH3 domain-containing protein n=1 Tax=uncultured Thalassospira sp. TaxID=404382 RepID=UPI0030D7DFF5